MSRRPVEIPGWDSDAEVVDEEYVERTPRRPEVRRGLERECHNLPILAPLLPLVVPIPHVVAGDGAWRVRHRLVPGVPATAETLTLQDGERLGSFLRVLHHVEPDRLDLGPDQTLPGNIERMRAEVVPLLDVELRADAGALLARAQRPSPLVVAHGDLGPAHVLVTEDGVSGVIDWTDSALHDPAIDLAWALHGTPAAFVRGIRASYRPTPEECRRAGDWHLLGPWHEVLWGIDVGGRPAVASGLAGAESRLRHERG